jgi:hypothetical protein
VGKTASPFSTDARAEILAHETRQMTRTEEKAELIYKDESRRPPALKILASFRVFRGQIAF